MLYSSAHHPFVQMHNNRGGGGWILVKAMLKTLLRRSEHSVHVYVGLFLFPVATKRLPHTDTLCSVAGPYSCANRFNY